MKQPSPSATPSKSLRSDWPRIMLLWITSATWVEIIGHPWTSSDINHHNHLQPVFIAWGELQHLLWTATVVKPWLLLTLQAWRFSMDPKQAAAFGHGNTAMDRSYPLQFVKVKWDPYDPWKDGLTWLTVGLCWIMLGWWSRRFCCSVAFEAQPKRRPGNLLGKGDGKAMPWSHRRWTLSSDVKGVNMEIGLLNLL